MPELPTGVIELVAAATKEERHCFESLHVQMRLKPLGMLLTCW
jgi:hypothetical protein